MADNVAITPGTGATVAADDIGGVLFQRVKPAIGADGTAVDVSAGAGNVGTGVQRVTIADDDTNAAAIKTALQIMDDWDSTDACKTVGIATNPTANFTRPADTTQYTAGDLVANSTTAGSVVAMTIAASRVAAGSFHILRAKLHKSTTTLTSAAFRLHLFRAAPATVTNGDNGAFSVSGVADYLGALDITIDRAFTDGAKGSGLPLTGTPIRVKLASGTDIFGLLEARAGYTPGNAEVFTVELEIEQD